MKKLLVSILTMFVLSTISQGAILADNHDGYQSSELKEKHQEVDQFVFEENQGDFSDQGFQVTHTGPVGDHIEIGITPYSEENAQYLYDQFGNELVKVVEGQMATTLADTNSSEVSTTMAQDSATQSEESSNTMLYIAFAAVIVILGAFFLFRKKSNA